MNAALGEDVGSVAPLHALLLNDPPAVQRADGNEKVLAWVRCSQLLREHAVRLIGQDPSSPDSWGLLAIAASWAHEHRQAHVMLDHAIHLDPHDPELHLLKAMLSATREREDERFLALKQARRKSRHGERLAPLVEYLHAHVEKRWCYPSAQFFLEAVAAEFTQRSFLEQGLTSLLSTRRNAWERSCTRLEGSVESILSGSADALDTAGEALEVDPCNAYALFNCAAAYATRGYGDFARAILVKLAAAAPLDPRLLVGAYVLADRIEQHASRFGLRFERAYPPSVAQAWDYLTPSRGVALVDGKRALLPYAASRELERVGPFFIEDVEGAYPQLEERSNELTVSSVTLFVADSEGRLLFGMPREERRHRGPRRLGAQDELEWVLLELCKSAHYEKHVATTTCGTQSSLVATIITSLPHQSGQEHGLFQFTYCLDAPGGLRSVRTVVKTGHPGATHETGRHGRRLCEGAALAKALGSLEHHLGIRPLQGYGFSVVLGIPATCLYSLGPPLVQYEHERCVTLHDLLAWRAETGAVYDVLAGLCRRALQLGGSEDLLRQHQRDNPTELHEFCRHLGGESPMAILAKQLAVLDVAHVGLERMRQRDLAAVRQGLLALSESVEKLASWGDPVPCTRNGDFHDDGTVDWERIAEADVAAGASVRPGQHAMHACPELHHFGLQHAARPAGGEIPLRVSVFGLEHVVLASGVIGKDAARLGELADAVERDGKQRAAEALRAVQEVRELHGLVTTWHGIPLPALERFFQPRIPLDQAARGDSESLLLILGLRQYYQLGCAGLGVQPYSDNGESG